MAAESTAIPLLLVDDEEDFRLAARTTLERRGFAVTEAASGEEAMASLERFRPEIIVLDLKMPGLSGIETLQKIRELDKALPVIILTGHGSFQDAFSGIQLEVVDFLQKPVDMDLLGIRIHQLLEHRGGPPLRESAVAELMVPTKLYPRLYIDQPVDAALEILRSVFRESRGPTRGEARRTRSALVYDREENFIGIIRFSDLMKLVLPPFLGESPFTTYFSGMLLAQCKLVGKRKLNELMCETVSVDLHAPLMQAVHLMVQHHLVNLPVMDQGELVGILREKDIIQEIIKNLGSVR